MRKYIGLALLAFLVSCKSAKPVLTEGSAGKNVEAEKIIQSHYANKKDFSTAYIKASARYKDDKQTQNVSAEIRIKKDQMILVSIRFLGITMAKALITPTEVKYYEKLNGNYFEGDFAALSQWLGTDLDYKKVQNLLIGQALDDLNKGNYKNSIEDNLNKLASSDGTTSKEYFFESDKFLLKKELISQSAKQRMLQVLYPNYNQVSNIAMPSGIVIDASQPKGKTNINIDYNSVNFNEELSFPYSVPEGYERIFIK